MSNNKYKSRKEWKELILTLSPENFEQLCYEVVCANKFINPRFRGRGPDGGRDIEAEIRIELTKKDDITEKCWFQCKRQKKGLNFTQISTEVQIAEDLEIDKYFILTNSDTTPKCKTYIDNWNKKHRCRIIDFSGSKFLDLLYQLPEVLEYYFPDEELPPIVTKETPKEIIRKSTEMGKFFDIKFEIKTDRKIDFTNISEVADLLKDSLIDLKNIDLNIKSLLLQKISMLFFHMSKGNDALMLLNKSLEITPKNSEALLKKGYILEKLDEIIESNECYDIILEIDNKNKFALNNKAANLIRIGEYEEALSLIDEALEFDPKFITAIINRANALKGLKRFQEALDFIDEIEKSMKIPIKLKIEKVNLCIDLLDFKKALEINEEVLEENPRNIDALNNKGVIYDKNSKFQYRTKYLDLAMICFQKLLEIDSKYPLGWSNKASILISYHKIDEAEKLVDSALEEFPNNPHLLNKKGAILLNKKKPKKALKFFNKGLKLLFHNGILLNKVKTQLALKQYTKAAESVEIYLKYNPEEPDGWFIKGKILKKLRRKTEANRCIENAKRFAKKPISLLE